MDPGIYNAIKNEYERSQKTARESLESRKREVYARIPRIREADDEIQVMGLKYNRLILLGTSPENQLLAEMLSGIERLEDEKVRLLESSGFPPDFLKPVYTCSQCKDTGFVEVEDSHIKCSCYRQLLIDQLYGQSNLKLLDRENFSTFNPDYYPDTIDEQRYGIKKSPRRHILGIKDKCLRFIENFSSNDEKNLYFYGPTGVGKTFLVNCIAAELLAKGTTVLYLTAPALFDAIYNYRTRAFRDEGFDDGIYRNIFEVELLIIDDLGTESQTSARYAELLSILDTRHSNGMSRPCKTIISTNIPPESLIEYYTERVASRVVGSFALLRFTGNDIRTVKTLSVTP